MENTKLIMLEGLPGTGKSTNSDFLRMQLQLNGKLTKWIHEVEKPHPVLFFNEASLTYDEYKSFLDIHPHCEQILNQITVFRKNTIGIDLVELEWNYMKSIGDQAFQYLQKFDVWNFPLDKQVEISLEKWAYFTEKALEQGDIYILDSSIFQFQIFTFLLKNAPYSELQNFIQKLISIVKPLNPSLIYLCRDNVNDTISFLEELRGIHFMERIWERDKDEPYYSDKQKGAEGHKQFLKEYSDVAKRLFDMADCRKISIDITNQNWEVYEGQMLSFLGIERQPYPNVFPPNGIYKNETLGAELEIRGLILIDPSGVKRTLTPKSDCEFYIERLSTVLRFHGSDKVEMSGGQIPDRWTASGTLFVRN